MGDRLLIDRWMANSIQIPSLIDDDRWSYPIKIPPFIYGGFPIANG